MAGLGTGAAPFRAFLQYLSWRRDQGEEIGPVYYYFGSRHQSQEYLYGEEVEAWILDNVITHAGLAFSRDGPKKVYIQHKMLEDSETLAKMLHDDQGVFYLCGPTWPVPDVYEALVAALGKSKNYDVATAGQYLEGLKEEERYVLEVSDSKTHTYSSFQLNASRSRSIDKYTFMDSFWNIYSDIYHSTTELVCKFQLSHNYEYQNKTCATS